MSLRSWLRPPRFLLVSFLAVTVLPAAALVWLGWSFFEQDRALEAQRLRERREQAADLVVVALQQALAASEQRLGQPFAETSPDAVVVKFDGERVTARPSLLYHPVVPAPKEPSAQAFARGEELEIQQQGYERAIAAFRELRNSPDAALRAGARLRIARNLRKAGKPEVALEEYRALAKCGPVRLEGGPADLVARRARVALLAQLNRTGASRQEAEALAKDLGLGRWELDRATFLHYAQAVRYEPPPEAAAFAAAVEWLWNKRKLAPAGRESRSLEGRRLTILWRGDAALVAGPSYVEQQWLAPLAPLLQSQAARLSLGTPASPGETLRAAADTGLPWPVVVSSEADLGAFTIRRRFLLAALTLVGALVLAGSYLIARAVHRELVAARLQSNFVAAVSHEFRTPLTLLRQITEAFTDGRVADEAERRRYYQAQGRATERLHRLVESLLDFGRMEAGAKPYRLETLDPARFVQGLVGEFQKEAAPGGYQVELHIAGTTPAVEADPDALTHAVWNLLDNAVKYSPGCRTVWVDLAREGDHVAIAVRDKGLGIPESEQKQIFRKFVRGAAARVNGIKGTGIGLAMVDHIVQAHGGTLRLVSAPGEGSTFTILLPASGQV